MAQVRRLRTAFGQALTLAYDSQQVERGDHWEIWKALPYARHAAPVWYASVGRSGPSLVNEVRESIQKHTTQYHLVFRDTIESFAKNPERTRKEFGALTCESFNQFVRALTFSELSPSREPTSPDYFIEPTLMNHPEGALAVLRDWFTTEDGSSEDAQDKSLGVILAPAGIGKTTVASALYSSIYESRQTTGLPVLITASQWIDLRPDADLQLADIWRESANECLRTTPRTDIFENYLRLGAILPVFDGFDELCAFPRHQFNPVDVLENLHSLVDDSDGRILLTARTDFWQDNVPEETRRRIQEFYLAPFNRSQVSAYIQQRFVKSPARARTVSAFLDHLKRDIKLDSAAPPSWLAGIPLLLDLICRWAELGGAEADYRDLGEIGSLRELFFTILERERERQHLDLTKESQFEWLCLLSVEFHGSFSYDAMGACLADISKPPSDKKLPEILSALKTHALIRSVSEEGGHAFRFDFLPDYFSSAWFVDFLIARRDGDVIDRRVRNLLARHANGQSSFHDYVARDLERFDEALLKISALIASMIAADERRALASLGHTVLRLLDRKGIVSHSERTAILLKTFGQKAVPEGSIRGISIEGTWKGLNLSQTNFLNVTFVNTNLMNCEFDADTTFRRCHFEGTFDVSGNGFRDAFVADDCSMDTLARKSLQRLRGPVDRLRITREDVRAAARDALKKFNDPWSRAVSIGKRDRFKGPVAAWSFSNDIWRALDETGVTSVLPDSDLISLRAEVVPDARRFLRDGVELGKIKLAIDWVMDRCSAVATVPTHA